MKRIVLALITFVFLVLLAPVFAFSMVAPWAVEDILRWWSSIVVIASLLGGGIAGWVYLESRS